MRVSLKIITALSLATLATGCSTVENHFASHVEKEPTLGSLKWSTNEAKVYLRTMYVQADFNADGTRRLFNEYDYKMETSPCTAFTKYSPRTNIFTVQHDKESLSFECRPYFGYDQPDLRRLYLLGSTRDCEDRTWDYQVPVLDSAKDAFAMCKDQNYIQKIEDRYQKWKDSGVFR